MTLTHDELWLTERLEALAQHARPDRLPERVASDVATTLQAPGPAVRRRPVVRLAIAASVVLIAAVTGAALVRTTSPAEVDVSSSRKTTTSSAAVAPTDPTASNSLPSALGGSRYFLPPQTIGGMPLVAISVEASSSSGVAIPTPIGFGAHSYSITPQSEFARYVVFEYQSPSESSSGTPPVASSALIVFGGSHKLEVDGVVVGPTPADGDPGTAAQLQQLGSDCVTPAGGKVMASGFGRSLGCERRAVGMLQGSVIEVSVVDNELTTRDLAEFGARSVTRSEAEALLVAMGQAPTAADSLRISSP